MVCDDSTGNLRYLDAARVGLPGGTLAGLAACTDGDDPIGTVDGLLIDPASRRVSFYVVEVIERKRLWKRRRYTIPAGGVVVLEGDRLRIEGCSDALRPFDSRASQPFSEEDLLATSLPPAAPEAA